MRAIGRLALVAAAVLAAALLAAAPAAAAGFMAGAAQLTTTPPAPGDPSAAAFEPDAALCPVATFPSHGRFALQEPFNDQNGNGQWDANADLTGSSPSGSPEPFCDANGNGRWDGIYADNGNGPATGVNDPIDVRAIAISDGRHKPVVYASVDQIGIFDFYTDDARSILMSTYKVDADLVVSADHNESSPDSIGLYGAVQTPLGIGVRSGIDEYYMSWLDDRIAHAAADAVHALEPARLFANQIEGRVPDGQSGNQYPLLRGLSERISDQFPTSVALPKDDRLAAVDPKLGVLQARRPDGTPIFTVMSVAAHNQEMGNSGAGISADWPGAFEHSFDASHPGLAMFLVGDNGSEEDPQTDPTVIPKGSENHSDQKTQYVQAQATGVRFAQITAVAADNATELAAGAVTLHREQLCVPLENNGFIALAAAGEFGRRQGYACDQSGKPLAPVPNGSITPTSSAQFRTFVGYTDVGPDLQLIDNPGEAFPALMLGSPFGAEEESCPRPNPAVPTWHARARYRFQVGLADDLLGYLIPAWGFASGTPGLFNNDSCYQDMKGHRHKLESESVGPTGANDVANALAALLDSGGGDPAAQIGRGRFVLPDGSYSRWPTGAAGILLPDPGATALDPAGGALIGGPSTSGFGGRAVDATGVFMDYDGQPQTLPDITTRGMMVFDARGNVVARYYLDVFPALDASRRLGPRTRQRAVTPLSCGKQVQPGAAPGALSGCCRGHPQPLTSARRHRLTVRRGHALRLAGAARAFSCGRHAGRVVRVEVEILRRNAHRDPRHCRFVQPTGRLGPKRACSRPTLLLARGTGRWRLRLRLRIPRGRYTIVIRAVDALGVAEAGGHRADIVRLRVR